MAYTAITAKQFRQKAGSLSEKLAAEFALVDAELASLEARIVALEGV